MIQIPFADISKEYQELKNEIDPAIASCLNNGAFISGPDVINFCNSLGSYLNVKHVIPCGNGTDAIQIALMALGLEAGDEVIIPAFGYVSPLEVAVLLKLKPVFIDVDPDVFTLDASQLDKVITPKTKAILPIHLFGQNADMEAILAFARAHNLFVIEDAAQSLGAKAVLRASEPFSGTMGHIGCTSFFPTKNLGCYGDGGAMFTNDDLLALRLRAIASHGQNGKYNYEMLGVNSRLDSLQAAILSVKLPHLEAYNTRRNQIASYYTEQFQSINLVGSPVVSERSRHIFHQYVIKLDSSATRNNLQKWLTDKGIATAIYYPKPLHLQAAYKHLSYQKGDFPVSERLCETTIALPIYPSLTDEQVSYIVACLKKFFAS